MLFFSEFPSSLADIDGLIVTVCASRVEVHFLSHPDVVNRMCGCSLIDENGGKNLDWSHKNYTMAKSWVFFCSTPS